MCGIAGFLNRSGDSAADSMHATALQMANTLRHRGPDDSGAWVDAAAGIALGHRRLSVVDLSPLGHQPMTSASGRYVISYNGEIYNFRSLRSELEAAGHPFRSQSDTEVLLAAFTQWGVAGAANRCNGMFAFAVWDKENRTLCLVRDRFGEKPLYYGWFDGALIFASELKALRAHPRFKGEIDRDALAMFMRYGYVPTPHCIYRGVHKLPQGTVLKVKSADSESRGVPETYWPVAETALRCLESPFTGSPADATEEFERLLNDAVRLRLEADVPLGAFLSGGIDSSTIVAIMQHQVGRPVRTFTVGFDEAPYNEAQDAKRVAQHLGTDHIELYVSPQEAMAVIPRLPAMYDEPFADSSQIPTFLISQLARRHVTVSLSGDGGDELLAGYNRYLLGSRLLRGAVRAPRFMRQAVGRALQFVAPATWDRVLGTLAPFGPAALSQRHIGSKVHRLAGVLTNGEADAYTSFMSLWDQPRSVVLGTTDRADWTATLTSSVKQLDETQRMMVMDAATYLPDDILVKVDRASMAVSLEARVPFLDPRVAEFCWSLPLSMKIRDGQQKWLLRQVLHRHVPRELVDRPKTGFAVPIDSWLRGPLSNWAEDLLDERTLGSGGFLNPEPVRTTWQRHRSGRENSHEQLWCALMFQSWLAEQGAAVSS